MFFNFVSQPSFTSHEIITPFNENEATRSLWMSSEPFVITHWIKIPGSCLSPTHQIQIFILTAFISSWNRLQINFAYRFRNQNTWFHHFASLAKLTRQNWFFSHRHQNSIHDTKNNYQKPIDNPQLISQPSHFAIDLVDSSTININP